MNTSVSLQRAAETPLLLLQLFFLVKHQATQSGVRVWQQQNVRAGCATTMGQPSSSQFGRKGYVCCLHVNCVKTTHARGGQMCNGG
jgi:hypothetical protein